MSHGGMDKEMAEAISNVVRELAEEIDWRYEEQDSVAAALRMQKVERAVKALRDAGFEPPAAAVDVLAKYKRQIN